MFAFDEVWSVKNGAVFLCLRSKILNKNKVDKRFGIWYNYAIVHNYAMMQLFHAIIFAKVKSPFIRNF